MLREQPSCRAIYLTPSPLRAITRISTACFRVNIDGQKTVSFAQVGQVYFGAVGQYYFGGNIQLYELEREVADIDAQQRCEVRRQQSRPVADALHRWMRQQRQHVPDGSATARAIDYSLKRWAELTRFIDDGELPIDNNWVENQIRPIALGRNNWLFAGSLRAGKRAAAVMSLIHSARLNGLDPYAYLRDLLERLPAQPSSRIEELLPHRWRAA